MSENEKVRENKIFQMLRSTFNLKQSSTNASILMKSPRNSIIFLALMIITNNTLRSL